MYNVNVSPMILRPERMANIFKIVMHYFINLCAVGYNATGYLQYLVGRAVTPLIKVDGV